VFGHVQREIEDRERTGEGKGPGRAGWDEAQSSQHDGDQHGAQQVADDVDEQIGEHDGVAIEVRPEPSELWVLPPWAMSYARSSMPTSADHGIQPTSESAACPAAPYPGSPGAGRRRQRCHR